MCCSFLLSSLVFYVVSFGLAWPLVARLALDATSKIAATFALSLLGVFCFGWFVYTSALPHQIFYVLPLLAITGIAIGWKPLRDVLTEARARELLFGQTLVACWCIGWLALITSYSGGGWAGDWLEHWHRTRFFLDHAPLDSKFLGLWPLSARPPLVNIVTGAFLNVAGGSFAHYQLITTLFGCLVFLPAALFTQHFGGGRKSITVLAVLLMLNPMFMQNTTFAWTKLPAAYFVLTGFYFLLRSLDDDKLSPAGPLCAASLAAGLLAHYSAGPYVVLLGIAWLVLKRRQWHDSGFWKQTVKLGLLGGCILMSWFGWSLMIYGMGPTFLSNCSSMTGQAELHGSQILRIIFNLRDTVVPWFIRGIDTALIEQTSTWGWWRDCCFQAYQLNLFLIFGSTAWLVILRELWNSGRNMTVQNRTFWTAWIAGIVILGVAMSSARDYWGVAHICLQPLVPLGLALLAARWQSMGRIWRCILVAGATLDFILGIALHFAVQNFAFDRWFDPCRSPMAIFASYSESSFLAACAKTQLGLVFFSDAFTVPPMLVLALLGTILTLVLVRASMTAD